MFVFVPKWTQVLCFKIRVGKLLSELEVWSWNPLIE